MVEVLRRYNVKQIYYTGALHAAPDYIAWLEEIKKQNIPLSIVNHPFEIKLGERAELEFLWPQQDYTNVRVSELNNTSVVNKLIFGEVSILMTGDIEMEVEEELIDSGVNLQANIIKAPHHGSKTSNLEEFLEVVNPEQVVIQSGVDNEYGHPHGRVLGRYEGSDVKIWRTDLDGRIDVFTDGQDYFVE